MAIRTRPAQRARRASAGWVVLIAFVLVLGSATPGYAAGTTGGGGSPASGTRAQRDQVRAQRAQLAVQVDALQASDGEVDRALRDLDENVRGQQAALADAERQTAEATAEETAAHEAAARKASEADALRARVAAIAVAAYVKPPGDDVFERFSAASATIAAQKEALLQARVGRATDLMDELRAARHEQEAAERRATDARARAEQGRAEAEARLADLSTARAQQAAFAGAAQDRLDAKLGEAAALARVDGRLAAQIAGEGQALVALLPPVPTPPPARPAPTPASGGGVTRRPGLGSVALATVGGITVSASIAGQLSALLAAAAADGLTLGGSGYRDPSSQIALRRAHCGTSDYAIYDMPASDCNPPTAKPGASMHEQGLAIDFTYGGAFIESRLSRAFRWLAANAGRFGFANLPSEPWHWSTTGR